MAHSETQAWAPCPCCRGQVAWKKNRTGLAYGRCDHCGVEVRHHWQKTSDKFMAQFAPTEKPAADDALPEKHGETPPPAGHTKSILSTLLG